MDVAKKIQLVTAVNEFIDDFEMVFDEDWFCSKGRFESPELYGCDQSFLYPDTDDEGNNWGNRAALLRSYRELVSIMMRQDIRHNPRSDSRNSSHLGSWT